jgi:hypothetical protein
MDGQLMPASISFARDIRPLFLPFDRDQMLFAFDLWSHGAVTENAAMILQRLEAGDMPCDRAWPEQQVTLFRAWIAEGCAA